MDYKILVGRHCYSVPKDIYDLASDMYEKDFLLLSEVDQRIEKLY